jgi:hypothetical protein
MIYEFTTKGWYSLEIDLTNEYNQGVRRHTGYHYLSTQNDLDKFIAEYKSMGYSVISVNIPGKD